MQTSFHSLYSHGFVRTAVCLPHLKVSNPQYNVGRTLDLARRASDEHAAVALFPELGITAYTNDDLFHQDTLLNETLEALDRIRDESKSLTPVIVVGAPLKVENKLFNCAVVCYRGKILGVVPKLYLPNYREFYEKRQFNSGRAAMSREINLLYQTVPFGNDLVFEARNIPNFSLFTEICEDIWSPIPPSTYAAMGGATVLCNLSASNITIGKTAYRKQLCASQSAKCLSAYLYAAAGTDESTTDLAWDGHSMIYENGTLLAETERFSTDEQIIYGDIDLDRLVQDRMRHTSFNDTGENHRDHVEKLRRISFDFQVPSEPVELMREVNRFPYVPSDPSERDDRCYEAYNIQVQSLAKRMQATGIEKVVIGISGGLDSTQALIVAAKTMDRLELPRTNILAYTMPGFATSDKTLNNAHKLMNAVGVTGNEIDIRPSCRQMLDDIGHPFVDGEPVYDITFENVQAGERTSHLFRLANFNDAMVVGTGDLSELALGWTTYGVGDHMSHYNVNVSVPKTLIQHLIRWNIDTKQFSDETCEVLDSILNTEISPELVPDDNGNSDKPAQSTEAKVGPYELQDFNLYYFSRYGYRPAKVAFLSYNAWKDKNAGTWPDVIPDNKRNAYDLTNIKTWMEVFLKRFFQFSQFKRSCIPNGPKVGSGGSLSPRGDWRAPSDSDAHIWLEELRQSVPDE